MKERASEGGSLFEDVENAVQEKSKDTRFMQTMQKQTRTCYDIGCHYATDSSLIAANDSNN